MSGETDPTSTRHQTIWGPLYSIGSTVNRNDNARTARRAVTFGAGIILGLSFLSGTASAAPSNERSTTYTEDSDTNDGGTPNNVEDEGNLHPSGKDRSVERGRSGNQGKAQSDPDDNGRGPDRSNGGADQPNGPGGMDMADQDGNNGCGNDDDFEDDNKGWCGKPKVTSTTPGTTSPGVDGGEIVKPVSNPEVAAEVIAQAVPAAVDAIDATVTETVATPEVLATDASPAAAVVESAQARRETQVLGVSIERPAGDIARGTQVLGVSFERGSLARTGFGLTLILAAVGLALVGIGLAIKKFNTQTV